MTEYTSVIVDEDNNVGTTIVEASGLGEAGQIAYGRAADEDRHVIAVIESTEIDRVVFTLGAR